MTENDVPRVLVTDPEPGIRRLVLNRPAKRNALDGPTRTALLSALAQADADESVRVVVVAGAGKDFCAGYDLAPEEGDKYGTAGAGLGRFQREVVEGWLSISAMRVPVIAEVHGNCLAGGSELAAGCDLVHVADDARIGYPAVRFGVPDLQFHTWLMGPRRAMEAVLTGDTMDGPQAVAAGFANRSHPAAELPDAVLDTARRIMTIDPAITQFNKRTVHRAMAAMGMHAAVRAGTEASALAVHTGAFSAFMGAAQSSVRQALTERDTPFGDGRTAR